MQMLRPLRKLPAACSFVNNQRMTWWKQCAPSRRRRADSCHSSSASRQSGLLKHISKKNLGNSYPGNWRRGSTPLCRYDPLPTQTRANVADGGRICGSAGVVLHCRILPLRDTPDPKLFRRCGSIYLFWPAIADDCFLVAGCGTLRTHLAGASSAGPREESPNSPGVPDDLRRCIGDRLLLSGFHFFACIHLD